MLLEECLQRILTEPTPEDLWMLQPVLRGQASPAAQRVQDAARQFYCYLVNVRSKLTSKQHSVLGAVLAATSIGVISARDLLDSAANDPEHLLQHMLAGGLAGSAEGLATLQHVRAWETEFASVHEEALWELYGLLWDLAADRRPDQPVETRHALIEQLLAPARVPELDGLVRMAYLIRIFQIVLVLLAQPLLAPGRDVVASEGETA